MGDMKLSVLQVKLKLMKHMLRREESSDFYLNMNKKPVPNSTCSKKSNGKRLRDTKNVFPNHSENQHNVLYYKDLAIFMILLFKKCFDLKINKMRFFCKCVEKFHF